MRPVSIDLPDHTRGDTWEGMAIGPVTFNGETPTVALSGCRMHFRDKGGALGQEFSSEDTTITISASGTWEVLVPAQALNLTSGYWKWDFETTDIDGIIRTLYDGSIRIIDDITY